MNSKLLAVRPRHIAAFLAVPALQFILMEGCTAFVVPSMIPWAMLASILFMCLMGIFLCFLLGSPRAAYTATGTVSISAGLLSAYLVHMRGTPFSLVDAMAVDTALSVAGNYGFYCDVRMAACGALSVSLLVLVWRRHGMFGPFAGIFRLSGLRIRAVGGAVSLVLLAGTCAWIEADYARRIGYADVPGKARESIVVMKTLESRLRVGTVYDFIFSAYQFTQGRPAGYDRNDVPDDIFERDAGLDAACLPDVTVIMDEAFSDPDDFGGSHATSDYMPFLRSFGDDPNSRLGSLQVPVRGGNTANTEFEVLTGASLSQFPTSSVPYLYAVNRDVPSLARYFSELGYETWAVHPYRSGNWRRSVVYGRMGFDHMVFTDMPDGDISFDGMPGDGAATYISDSDCLSVVSEILGRRADDGRPRFVFVVTVQNHGPYTYDFAGVGLDVQVGPEISDPDDREAMSRYLSLLKASDGALREFTADLSDRDFDALVAFFGDHQPDASAHMRFERYGDPDKLVDDYKVPYGLWATYALPEDLSLGYESAAYVGADLFTAVGAGMPDYYEFMERMRETDPVFDRGSTSGHTQEYACYTWYRIRDPKGWRPEA